MRRYRLILLLTLAGGLLFGCGPKARVDIYLEPVAADDEYTIDQTTGTLEVEKEGVRIRVRALDTADLLLLAEDEDWNPYVRVSTWGRVTPLFTVFQIEVENQRETRVEVGPTALLIDADGSQYASLPYDFFKDTYDTRTYERTEVYHSYYDWYDWYWPYRRYPYYYWRGRAYYPLYYTPYWYYHPRPRSYYVRRTTNKEAPLKRLTARETLFQGAKLFPGARRSGLLVFERIEEGAQDLRLVIPEVRIFRKGRKRPVEIAFTFDFRQVVNVSK